MLNSPTISNNFMLSGLGYWNVYFIIKFILFYQVVIGFNFLPNLAFAAFLLIPIKGVVLSKLKNITAVIFAVLLLHHDSWLPPLDRLLSSGGVMQDFSFGYLVEISSRFINWEFFAILLIVSVGYLFLKSWVRFSSFVLLGIFYFGIFGTVSQVNQNIISNEEADHVVRNNKVFSSINSQYSEESTVVKNSSQLTNSPESALKLFYQQQSSLATKFPSTVNGELFDVVILNVCSLSWADMRTANLMAHPLLSKFDIVFKNFSSATSYSGPAAIRLFKASCGQPSHTNLYESSPKQCYLFDNLANLGFETNFAMNHNGLFDDFIGIVRNSGHLNTDQLSLKGVEVIQNSFDGTPIYSDFEVLNRWLSTASQSKNLRHALYYNSISLHDGNKIVGGRRFSNSINSYQPRAEKLFTDIDQFIKKLESSGRNVVLIMAPEHGASLSGDKMQVSGMREIPSPDIANIPVLVKFIGKNITKPNQLEITQPSSYLAISQLLSNVIENNPFTAGQLNLPSLTADLPQTQMVAENSGTIMLMHNGKPYIKLDDGEWMLYPGY